MIFTTSPRRDLPIPNRATLLTWLKGICPSLGVTNEVVGGERVTVLAYDLDGARVRVGNVNGDRVVLHVVNVFRARLRLPPFGVAAPREELEQEIVRASANGDDKLADHLAHELVMRNEGLRTRVAAPFESQWSRPL